MQGATPEVTPTQKMVGPRVDISPGVVRGPEAGRQDCWRCWGLPQGYLTQVEAEAVWSCRPGLLATGFSDFSTERAEAWCCSCRRPNQL